MYTLHISLKLVAIVKIVAASNPGGMWLPYRGRDVVMTAPFPPAHRIDEEVMGSIPVTSNRQCVQQYIPMNRSMAHFMPSTHWLTKSRQSASNVGNVENIENVENVENVVPSVQK